MSGLGGEAEILCSTTALPVLTPTGHKRPALLRCTASTCYTRHSPWALVIEMCGASSLTCSAARLLHWPHEKTDWEKNHARDRSCFAQYRNDGFAAHRR